MRESFGEAVLPIVGLQARENLLWAPMNSGTSGQGVWQPVLTAKLNTKFSTGQGLHTDVLLLQRVRV